MTHTVGRGGLHYLAVPLWVAHVAGLEEQVALGNGVLLRHLLIHPHSSSASVIDYLELVDAGELDIRVLAPLELRGTSHEIHKAEGRVVNCPVCLNRHIEIRIMESVDESAVNPQARLATSDDYEMTVAVALALHKGFHLADDFIIAHNTALFVLRIAEGAMEIAPREAHEHRRSPGVIPFTLEGVEYLVNLPLFHIATL